MTSDRYKISGEDLYFHVLELEKKGVDALLSGEATAKYRGSFVFITFNDSRVFETTPNILYVVDRLSSSSLPVDSQQEILEGCDHVIAINYLNSLIEQDSLDNTIDIDEDDDHMEF